MTKPLLHAHFDCFGGAAGDMMLAACIDAADSLSFPLVLPLHAATDAAADNVSAPGSNSERLLSRLIFDLENGIPELKGEFRLSSKRVWRSAGRIAARKVHVSSVYDHKAAPVPGAGGGGSRVKNGMILHDAGNHHDHQHNHQHNHDHAHHSSSSELKEDPQTINNDDDNDIDDGSNVLNARDDHSHNHSHSRSNKDNIMVDGHQSHDHHHHHHHHHHHEHSHSHGHNQSHGHGHDHHHSNNSSSSSPGKLRNLPQISKMLASSSSQYIPTQVARLTIDTFTALAHAEMHAHGSASIDDVHFHEVGAVDSIVDTVGTLLALYHLGVDLGGRKGQTGKKSSEDSVDDNEGDYRAPTIAVTCSALPLGEGTVMTDHGLLPVPAPAALRLMIGMPTCPGPIGPTGELVTPTAAALLRVLTGIDSEADRGNHRMPLSDYWQPVRVPGRPPRMKVRAVGLGAGSKDFERHANILRLILGDTDDARKRESICCGGSNSGDVVLQTEEVTNQARVGGESQVPMEDACLPGNVHSAEDRSHVTTGALNEQTISKPWDMHTLTHIEANIDDATSELLAHALNLLLENGAIDAWIHPIIMKKGRPAHSLHCICRSDSTEHSNDEERLLNIMFRHTTTVGIRIHRNILRAALKRRFVEVKLPYTDNSRCGRVDVKISSFNDGQIISVKPEFEHCKVVSEESDIPLKVVSLEAENMGRMFICEHLS